ncbi:hypothetical protein J7348_11035 [Qipengyuania flava]|uniref:hypothetical protein n=1 Tax=Qipengyuania flava TaxID=192812 RepID=UPI001ADB4FF0|nr:hypothetical protein [Qipengyuania flava]MBO9505154.1 hypothetical protein [Qipengyuania flava]
MKRDDKLYLGGDKEPLSEVSYNDLPLDVLAKRAGLHEKRPKALSCKQVLRLSEKRVMQCLAAGYDKAMTAAIVAEHPLNTASLASIERTMNDVFGSWTALKRAHRSRVSSQPEADAAVFGSKPHDIKKGSSGNPPTMRGSLTDEAFQGEDRL